MHLTPREEERLLIASAADLARRRIARGAQLGATEAIALACDEALEAAWDGKTLDEVIQAGRDAIPAEALLPGVAALVPQIQIEALFPHGSVLVAIPAPFGAPDVAGPGAVIPASAERELAPGRQRVKCTVTNSGVSTVWISSHMPLNTVNEAIAVQGLPDGRQWRLDQPAGFSLQFEPGESKEVVAVETPGTNN